MAYQYDTTHNASGAVDPTPQPIFMQEEYRSRKRLMDFNKAVIGMAKALKIQVLTRIELRDNETGVELRWNDERIAR